METARIKVRPVDVKKLISKNRPTVVDIYAEQLRELSEVQFKELKVEYKKKQLGDWIYYSWNNTLLHLLREKEQDILRTNRNKNLITASEQKRLFEFTIAIAGLSVGGNVATTLLYNGFPKRLKLADADVLRTTNLNRVRAKIADVGLKKIDVISRQLYEVDPYIKITAFPNGLSKSNLKDFVGGEPKPKLIFEFVDDFRIKILIRKEAKKQKVPVIMMTSLGDNILIDIERYDIKPATKIFNGVVDEKIIDKILTGEITEKDKQYYAVQLVGRENIPQKALESLKQIGKTLVGRPQLMSTVTVASGIAVFIARKIALKEDVKSGRILVKLNEFVKI